MSQDLMQEDLAAGGGNGSTSTGFVTGTTCTSSGTYRAENRYMTTVQLYAAGDIFRAGVDGKKVTWYALGATSDSNKDGAFTSVKVDAGTV